MLSGHSRTLLLTTIGSSSSSSIGKMLQPPVRPGSSIMRVLSTAMGRISLCRQQQQQQQQRAAVVVLLTA
jgi:hypothetical protein